MELRLIGVTRDSTDKSWKWFNTCTCTKYAIYKNRKMKKFIILIFVCFSWINLVAQDICIKDSIKYLNAYNYILNDSINLNKTIFVSDTLIDLDRIWFLSDLDSLPKEKAIIKSLINYSWKPNFYSDNISKIFFSNYNDCNSKTVLFFSWIEKNTLCVDLFQDEQIISEFDYNKIASQNKSHMYLFIFDLNGKIEHVFRKEILYSF